jgi:hypothetical protein
VFTVRDRSSGAELYSVRAGAVPVRDRSLLARSFDLQADGKLAFSVDDGRRTRIAWASAAESRAHVIDMPRSGHAAVRWAGSDRLLVLRTSRRAAGTVTGGVLELRGLDGRLLRTVARGVVDRAQREAFYTDGERVTFVTRRCAGVRLHVLPLEGGPTSGSRSGACPLRLREGVVHVRGRRELRATVSCTGFVTVCSGLNAVATARVGGRARVIARDPVTAAASPALRMALNPLGRRLLARRPHARVRLAVTLGDPSLVAPGAVTARQRRAGRFAVR